MSSNQKNLRVWSAVEKTAPSATKRAKVNGQDITSISGHHMFHKATETFGPYGIGWGCEVVNEEYVTGGAILGGSDKATVIGHNIMHTMRMRLWYVLDGERGHAEHVGCTPFVYRSSYGSTTDLEAPKKTFTDAVKKCLSMLGFSADVFMGMHDDADYVAELQEQEAIESAEDRDAAVEAQRQERLEWLRKAVEAIDTAATENELKKLHAKFVRDASRRGEDAFVKRLHQASEDRKKTLGTQGGDQ